MADHPYEYQFMNLFITPKPGELPDYTSPEIRDDITQQLGGLADSLQETLEKTPDGKTDWTINSHSLAFIGGLILVTILLQRNRS